MKTIRFKQKNNFSKKRISKRIFGSVIVTSIAIFLTVSAVYGYTTYWHSGSYTGTEFMVKTTPIPNWGTVGLTATYVQGTKNNANNTTTYTIRLYDYSSNPNSYTYYIPREYMILRVNGQEVYRKPTMGDIRIYGAGYYQLCEATVTLTNGVSNSISWEHNSEGNGAPLNNATGYLTPPASTFGVTFTNWDGSVLKMQTVDWGNSATPPANPSRNGYTFAGWSGSYTNVNTDRVITATFNPNTYYVTYNANGGSNAPGTTSFKFNSTAYISNGVPTRTGYTFKCWNTIANGTGTNFYPGGAIPNGWGSFTLYAQWTANTYTITYNANGGTGTMANQTFTYDTAQTLRKNTFSKTGNLFKGWNTKADGTGTNYNDQQSVKNLTSIKGDNILLYAQWINENPVITAPVIPDHLPDINSGIKPFIENNKLIIQRGDVFNAVLYATALDKEDGDITELIKIKSTTVPLRNDIAYVSGEYLVLLEVTDSGGNVSTCEMDVLVNDPPILTTEDRYFFKDQQNVGLMELISKVKVSDKEDGDISNKVKITSITYASGNTILNPDVLDTSITQNCSIKYSVTDAYKKSVDKQATIYVVEDIVVESAKYSVNARYITKDFLSSLADKSIWKTPEYSEILKNSLSNTIPVYSFSYSSNSVKEARKLAKELSPSYQSNCMFVDLFLSNR